MKKQPFIKAAFIACCILLAAVACSCEFTPGYYIQQEVADHVIKKGAYLKTEIWHNGAIVQSWYDEITLNTPDTIKCYRHRQSEEFIIKLKKIESACNSR